MKITILFLFFLTLCSCGFAEPSDVCKKNIDFVWDKHEDGNINEAILYLKNWIYNPEILDIDKVHYLVALATITCYINPKIYNDAIAILEFLFFNYQKCADEMFSYYEINFINMPRNH